MATRCCSPPLSSHTCRRSCLGNLGEHCFGGEDFVGSGGQVDVVVDGLVWDEGVVLEEVAHIVAPVFSGLCDTPGWSEK